MSWLPDDNPIVSFCSCISDIDVEDDNETIEKDVGWFEVGVEGDWVDLFFVVEFGMGCMAMFVYVMSDVLGCYISIWFYFTFFSILFWTGVGWCYIMLLVLLFSFFLVFILLY